MNTSHDNSIELAWAAGFFDGEGCVTGYQQTGRRRGRLQLIVGQSGTTEHLERFARAVEGGRINGPYLNQGKLPRYVWQTNGHKARRVMELLRPYLCSPKVLKFDAIKEVYCP
jgi:hypothetical protein